MNMYFFILNDSPPLITSHLF